MVNLTYEAVDATGRRVSDDIKAESSKAAVDRLRERGMTVTSIQTAPEAKPESQARAKVPEELADLKLPLKAMVVFTRQMAMLLASGSALVPALAAIVRQLKKPQHAELVRAIKEDLEEGATLAETLQKYPRTFDATYCAVIAAGETSANLPEMFSRLAEIIGKRRALRNKVLGAMAYPALLTLLCIAQVCVLLFFVLPRFGEMFNSLSVPLPASTKFMLDLADALTTYWPVLAGAAIGGVFLIAFLVGTVSGRQWCSNVQIKIPFVGRLASGLIQGQLFRSLGMLLEARVSVLESLDLARRTTKNEEFQRLFDSVEQAVTSGNSFSDALERSRLIDPAICQAVRTGEESGSLGSSMSYAADVLDEDNTELVNTVTKLLEPMIIILMGVIVGAVAISLFMPLFDITTMVN